MRLASKKSTTWTTRTAARFGCSMYHCSMLVPQELTEHALYMRLQRLCEPTKAKKLQVPEAIAQQWLSGDREELQLALAQALKIHGIESSHKIRKQVRLPVLFCLLCARCSRFVAIFFVSSFHIKYLILIVTSQCLRPNSSNSSPRSTKGVVFEKKNLRASGVLKSECRKSWDTQRFLAGKKQHSSFQKKALLSNIDQII